MGTANALNVEGFDPAEWNIGREWRGEEFMKQLDQAPEKIEYKGGIFICEYERLTVPAGDDRIFTRPSKYSLKAYYNEVVGSNAVNFETYDCNSK